MRIPATTRTPEVFFAHDGEFRFEPHWHLNTIIAARTSGATAASKICGSPGAFRWTLSPGQTVHLACSTEPVELDRVLGDLDRAASENLDRQTSVVNSEADTRLEMLIRAAESFVVSVPAETPAELGEGDRPIPLVASGWSGGPDGIQRSFHDNRPPG